MPCTNHDECESSVLERIYNEGARQKFISEMNREMEKALSSAKVRRRLFGRDASERAFDGYGDGG